MGASAPFIKIRIWDLNFIDLVVKIMHQNLRTILPILKVSQLHLLSEIPNKVPVE